MSFLIEADLRQLAAQYGFYCAAVQRTLLEEIPITYKGTIWAMKHSLYSIKQGDPFGRHKPSASQ
jgi:hypothetical protein